MVFFAAGGGVREAKAPYVLQFEQKPCFIGLNEELTLRDPVEGY
jgi:hypothetical protein